MGVNKCGINKVLAQSYVHRCEERDAAIHVDTIGSDPLCQLSNHHFVAAVLKKELGHSVIIEILYTQKKVHVTHAAISARRNVTDASQNFFSEVAIEHNVDV